MPEASDAINEPRESDASPGVLEILDIPEVMDEEQACRILGISHKTAYRFRTRGTPQGVRLRFCRYGVKVRYKREHILAFLNAHEVAG